MLERVESTKTLHAHDFASNILRKLEVHGHFTALREWAIFTDEDYVEYLLLTVVCCFKLDFLTLKNWPLRKHERLEFVLLHDIYN